ncbi:hypothetical protein DYQ86_00135 [Acidobacteria bacterium AB60]|nr:hypothetical protein DYQ86_00135 [Acidobacteria bacterium AB60]
MTIQGLTPAMSAPVAGQTASASSPTGGSNSSTSASSLQTTFLNLLVTELQNQDPTSPVDPTAMVGQMVSLNELDQLISINQVLQQSFGSGTGTTPAGSGSVPASRANGTPSAAGPATAGLLAGVGITPQTPAPLQAASPTSLSANSLMNLYGNFTAPVSGAFQTISGGK